MRLPIVPWLIYAFVLIATVLGKDIPTVNGTIACGSSQPLLVTEQYGILSSPNFDNFHYYPAHKNCSWTLEAPKGKVFVLRTLFFSLNMECESDSLNLYEGAPPKHKRLGQYCGYWIPARYKAKSNILYLNFISGRNPRGVGFQFYFQQEDPTVVCEEGELSCRHRSKCVPQKAVCDGVDDCGDGTDEEKCVLQMNSTSECGVPKVPPVLQAVPNVYHVVGGKNAVPGSWPWQVSLRLVANEPYSHQCGGVFINEQWVLTAGHCFRRNLDVRYWNVLLGKHFKLVPDETDKVRYMQSIHLHPGYRGLNDTKISTPWLIKKQHDIALVKLNAPVTFTDYISPVCLPPANYSLSPGTTCYVTGWGDTYGTGFELELKQAQVPVVSLEQCRKWHRFYDVAPSMLCAGHAEGGQDSCNGDSGGPLVYSEDGRQWHLAGVVSTGGSICAEKEKPGIYTAVPFYIDWIESTILTNT